MLPIRKLNKQFNPPVPLLKIRSLICCVRESCFRFQTCTAHLRLDVEQQQYNRQEREVPQINLEEHPQLQLRILLKEVKWKGILGDDLHAKPHADYFVSSIGRPWTVVMAVAETVMAEIKN